MKYIFIRNWKEMFFFICDKSLKRLNVFDVAINY